MDRVPIKFLKYLDSTDGLYEIKVSTILKRIRIFCFFDKNRLIILINCFVKKTQKTPKNDLNLAIKLKKKYFVTKKEKY